MQWGCRSGGGLGVEGVLVQLGLRPVLLFLPHHPHHNRSHTWSWSKRFLSSYRLWKFCRRNIWGPAFLSPVWDDWWERLKQNKNKFWWNMFPPGIPLMLSVLADVGGLMAGGLEGAWWVLFSDTAPAYLEKRRASISKWKGEHDKQFLTLVSYLMGCLILALTREFGIFFGDFKFSLLSVSFSLVDVACAL